MVKIKRTRPIPGLDGIAILGVDPSSMTMACVGMSAQGIGTDYYKLGKKSGADCCAAAIIAAGEIANWEHFSTAELRVAFVERPAVARGGINTTIVQALTIGAFIGELHRCGFQVTLVPPTTWKKSVVGRGNSDKSEITEAVRSRWPTLYEHVKGSQDLIDASAIAIYGGRQIIGPGFMAPGSEVSRIIRSVLRS